MAIVKRSGAFGVVVYEKGRRRWVGTRKTLREAKELEAKALLERHLDGSLTVGQFASTWLERYPRPKRSTEQHYAEQIRGFVARFENHKLRDLSRALMRQWAVEHRSQVQTARAMLGDAYRDGLIGSNPLGGMKLPESRGRRDIAALTEDDVTALAEAAEKAHGDYGRLVYAPMILVAAYTGVRPGELHGLRWTDVDWRGATLRVERQFSPKVKEFTTPKNGKPRTVPLLPPAIDALRTLEEKRGPRLELFTTKTGAHFSGRVSHYYFDPVRAAAGKPEMDWYELRHACGSMLARLGLGAPEIARVLGHTDGGQLALRTYIHVSEAEAVQRAKDLYSMPRLKAVNE